MNKLERKLKEVESWACCEYPARAIRAEYNADVLTQSVNWYKERVSALQLWMLTIPETYTPSPKTATLTRFLHIGFSDMTYIALK